MSLPAIFGTGVVTICMSKQCTCDAHSSQGTVTSSGITCYEESENSTMSSFRVVSEISGTRSRTKANRLPCRSERLALGDAVGDGFCYCFQHLVVVPVVLSFSQGFWATAEDVL